MNDLSATRSVLRIIHNGIFFGCILSAVTVSFCDKYGIAPALYIFRLLAAFLFVILFFLFKDFVLAGSKNHGFALFLAQLVAGIALVYFAGRFIIGDYTVIKIMMILLSLAIAVMAFYEHNHGKPAFYPSFLVIPVYAAVFFFGRYLKDDTVMVIAVAAEVASIFVYIIDHEFTNLEFSIKQVKDRAYVPTETIRKQNLSQLLMFLLPMGVLVVLCFLFPYSGQVADLFISVIVFITRTVINLLLKTSDMIPEETQLDGPGSVYGQIPTKEFEKLARLWDIVFYLATIIMVLVIVWALVSIIRQFYKRFKQSSFVGRQDSSEFLDPGEEKRKNREKGAAIGFFDRSARASVRRIYKRFIKKHPGAREISRADTPRELEKKALGDKVRNYPELRNIYEKARYSPSGCTKEDAARLLTVIREGRK